MDDCISRQAAIDTLTEDKEMINAILDSLTLDYNVRRNLEQRRGQINDDIETILDLPSIEPVRRGYWRLVTPPSYMFDGYRCSECNTLMYGRTNYCPDCGAKMEGINNATN